ncbi:MAG: ParB/RepB/Spo0J family partition protein [Burkholderiaceae bacterium]|jgi:ParB family chromosome partitioning protein|nr:ParB/RepB/Spo0J family partition protein [Burkholderiaceae bacterium]
MSKNPKLRAKGLGRGLDALLGGDEPPRAEPARADEPTRALPLDVLQPGRYQPRTRMDESSLQELAASIRGHGVMQPIVVRPIGDGRWEIIAGERRFRAAGLAGLSEVPVVVREVSDEQALAMALIENLQREDLNPLEQAQAIRRLTAEFGYSHEQAADALGRSRSATTNLLRLLQLAEPVQTMLLAGDLDMGHARALLAVDRAEQILLAQRVIDKRLSVRETEQLVQRVLADAQQADNDGATRRRRTQDRDVERLQERIADALATPVALRSDARGRGKLTISFSSHEQFQGLLERLGVETL